MKRCMVTMSIGVLALAIHLPTGVEAQGIPQHRTPEQRARMLEAKARHAAALGGIIEKPASGNIIRFVNAQSIIDESVVSDVAGKIAHSLMARHEMETVDAKGCDIIELAQVQLARQRVGVVIVVTDDKSLPTLLVAPEEGWCVINARKLSDDLPPQDTLVSRIRKEMGRAAAFVLGGGNSQMRPCVMTDIHKPSDLDVVEFEAVSPEVVMKMLASMGSRDIQPRMRTSYRRACQEGWAPPPTNDVQKAIWEQVKADKERGPTNPITIKPPKK